MKTCFAQAVVAHSKTKTDRYENTDNTTDSRNPLVDSDLI